MGCRELDHDPRREDFVRLFERHQRSLYAYVLSLVPNVAAADEVSQNTNLLLWEEFGRFDPGTDFLAWARTIAYYQVLTYRKKAARERLRFDSELVGVLADRAGVRSDGLAARQKHLLDCLAKLSEFKRQAIRLCYLGGMTAASIAQKLGRNVAGVEKTLVRTRRALYECIEAAVRREEHS